MSEQPKVTRSTILSEEYARGAWNATHPRDEQLTRDAFFARAVYDTYLSKLMRDRERQQKYRAKKREEATARRWAEYEKRKRMYEEEDMYQREQAKIEEPKYMWMYYSPFADDFSEDSRVMNHHK